MVKKGIFITFEGIEGCGKSTQSKLLCKRLRELGFSVLHTREPGGNEVSEKIRTLLLSPANTITPIAELLLYEASRAQLVKEVIEPAIKKGFVVVCDRFSDATLAYQGYARGLGVELVKTLNKIATQGITPNLTIYLHTSVEKGLSRARGLEKSGHKAGDRIERESLAFHKKVRNGYLAVAKTYPGRVKVINVANTIEKTQKLVFETIKKCLKI
ncbi:MAG: dTMP kinase [Endomicrobiales bacterium]|nr:dTMP kinase [Endomicrobiales bacterium]